MPATLYVNVFITLIAASSTFAFAASFDCTKARSEVEKAICKNDELGKLDEDLSEAYKVAVKNHPVQNYVRARQREWIKDNNSCDKDRLVACLKARYAKRIVSLKTFSSIKTFSNSPKFEYSNGDAVAEITQINGKFNIYVWGGFRIHRQASSDSGKQIYTGCEFEGEFSSPNGGKAVGLINGESKGTFDFTIMGNKITYPDPTQICEGGFASLPESLTLVGK